MATEQSYLAGLRRELAGAKTLGKKTVAQIEAEIKRVEDLIGDNHIDAAAKEIEAAVAPVERAVAPVAPVTPVAPQAPKA